MPVVTLEAENDQLVPMNGIPIVALTFNTENPVLFQATPVALSEWLYKGVVVLWVMSAADTFIAATCDTKEEAFFVAVVVQPLRARTDRGSSRRFIRWIFLEIGCKHCTSRSNKLC